MKTHQFSLTGVRCASCVAKIEKSLQSIEGASEVKVNFADHSVLIKSADSISPEIFIRALKQLGYGASLAKKSEQEEQEKKTREKKYYYHLMMQTIVAFVIGIPLSCLFFTSVVKRTVSPTLQLFVAKLAETSTLHSSAEVGNVVL